MGVPARASAAARDRDTADKHDPRARGWADVREALITAAHACALAVEELARDPGSAAALDMAGTTRTCLEHLGEIGRRWVLDEQVLEQERAQAYAEGVEACKAARRRLEVIDGG